VTASWLLLQVTFSKTTATPPELQYIYDDDRYALDCEVEDKGLFLRR